MNLIAIDLGTAGVRALIIDSEGRQRGATEVEVATLTPSEGHAEQAPDSFWRATVQAVRSALRGAGIPPDEIAAIGFSHQRGTFALADVHQQPLTRFVLWMDQRGLPFLDLIQQRIPLVDYYSITGLPIYYVSSISKLLWFAHRTPELYHAARYAWPISNFIMARMGIHEPPVDHATASFYGLLNTCTRQWSSQIADVLGLDGDRLPSLVPPGTVAGELSDPDAASELGLAVGTPVVIGGGDQQCAALGSGMIEARQALINLGTATAVMVAVDGPVRDSSYVIPSVCHAVPGQWELEGHTQASGIVLRRFRDEFAASEVAVAKRLNRDIYELLSEEVRLSPAGASGLLFLPTLNGSTAPINYPYSSGVLVGLRVTHARADVIRAMMEGMCFESRWILEHMEMNGAAVDSVRFSGGGSRSPLWCQMHADILQRPIARVGTSNAAAVGAAICAGMGIGLFRDAPAGALSLGRVAETYEPNPEVASLYERLYDLFKETYAALQRAKVFEVLHSLKSDSPA
ncbi:MAG TPA: FGGY family carbohydrate kinase [Aggregatilineaceae bacterium]|nr:FGGY family carbohydrate kinase [Aggregatilineaceae bacterium]